MTTQTPRRLQSYLNGEWIAGTGAETLCRDAATGAPVAVIAGGMTDPAAALHYARSTGGRALRAMTFHQRAEILKALAQDLLTHKAEFYAESAQTGATRTDSWVDIEGGVAVLFAYSSMGRRQLPNARHIVEGPHEQLSKPGNFLGQHLLVPLEGAAIQINAFNFPVWGMLEKFAPAFLAGMPSIVKPASQTAYLTEAVVRRMIGSGLLPAGSLQFIAGSVGDLLAHVGPQDTIGFTGSASTGQRLRTHPTINRHSVRFTMEADSLNCAILGPDAAPGSDEFDLFVKEVAREMTVKAGQKCTAIRRILAPDAMIEALTAALAQRLDKTAIGDPRAEGVTMGALASLDQRIEVRAKVAALRGAAELVYGDPDAPRVANGDTEAGAFLSPILLACNDPLSHSEPHEVEAFGPVSTIMPYKTLDDALEIARRGGGSLAASVFTNDPDFARDAVHGLAPWTGRVLLGNRRMAKESTGHGSPLPQLIHGGPGRAGGGEEMGGLRGVTHHMARVAVQGAPDFITAAAGRWTKGSAITEGEHPFRKDFNALEIGDAMVSAAREITLEDIEHFAHFTGDTFYAHMDEAAAKANPFFDGRVAHGYYIVSLAAGLFVDPAPGPVLANYGVDNLRFLTPAYPGDRLRVTLVCKEKTLRDGKGYGEVRWDACVTNQEDAVVAQYDVLTLVSDGTGAAA